MTKLLLASLLAFTVTACAREGGNQGQQADNLAAEGGADLNEAISGDELDPIAGAEDDMIANNGNRADQAPAGNDVLRDRSYVAPPLGGTPGNLSGGTIADQPRLPDTRPVRGEPEPRLGGR